MKNILTNTTKTAYKGLVFWAFFWLTVFSVAYAASITSTTDTVSSWDSITANWYQDVNNKLWGISVSGDYVGIWTSNPSWTLHINSSVSRLLKLDRWSNKMWFEASGLESWGLWLYDYAASEYQWFAKNGSVWIWTEAPVAKLHVDAWSDLKIWAFTTKPSTTVRWGWFYGDDVWSGRAIMRLDANDWNFINWDYFYITHKWWTDGTDFKNQAAVPMTFSTSWTERMRIDANGNVWIWNTPSNWNSGYNVLQLWNSAFLRSDKDTWGNFIQIWANAHQDGSGWKYRNNGQAFMQSLDTLWMNFYVASSWTAGNAIAWNQAMVIAHDGQVWIWKSPSTSSTNEWITFRNWTNAGRIFSTMWVSDYVLEIQKKWGGRIWWVHANISNNTVAFYTSSDYRLKENVTPMTNVVDRVNALNPVRFNFKSDKGNTVDWFIAHEVGAVIPEAVSGEKDWVDAEGNPEYQSMDYSKVTPLLTAALQEALKEIELLKKEVELLKNK